MIDKEHKKADAGKMCPKCSYKFSWNEIYLRVTKFNRFLCPACGQVSSFDLPMYYALIYWFGIFVIVWFSIYLLGEYLGTSSSSDNILLEKSLLFSVVFSGILAGFRYLYYCRNYRRLKAVPSRLPPLEYKGKWFIYASWSVFIISEITEDFLAYNPYSSAAYKSRFFFSVSNIGFLSLCLALSSMIFIGVRTLRGIGFKKKRLFLMPALAVAICLILSIFSAYMCWTLSSFQDNILMYDGRSGLKKEINDPHTTTEQRSKLSEAYAAETFVLTGKIIEYTRADGVNILYKPTEADKRAIKTKGTVKDQINSHKLIMIILPIICFLSLMFSIGLPLKCEKNSDHAY